MTPTTLSPRLRDLPDDLRLTKYTRDDEGNEQAYITVDFYEAMVDELRTRWNRDLAFARRVCAERGFDIDALAAGAPEYA